jgi:hypothetical protein
MAEAHFRHQPLEAEPPFDSAAGSAEIVSMVTIVSRAQPKWNALSTSAYWSLVDSWLRSTC